MSRAVVRHMLKRIILPLLGILIIPAGFYFEAVIQKTIPQYTAMLFFSGVLFITGMVIFFCTKNMMVMVVTFLATIALPWLIRWIIVFWPFN